MRTIDTRQVYCQTYQHLGEASLGQTTGSRQLQGVSRAATPPAPLTEERGMKRLEKVLALEGNPGEGLRNVAGRCLEKN